MIENAKNKSINQLSNKNDNVVEKFYNVYFFF